MIDCTRRRANGARTSHETPLGARRASLAAAALRAAVFVARRRARELERRVRANEPRSTAALASAAPRASRSSRRRRRRAAAAAMGKSARAACKREVRASRLHALNETDDDRAKFDAKQAAMARAMAAPKVPVVNSRAHQNMTMETDDANGARSGRDVVVDAETLARAEDAARRNDEAVAWGMNAVGKADIFLKTKKGGGVTKKGRRPNGAPTPRQLAAQTFQNDSKARKKMKRQLKQVKSARLKVPA